MSTVFVAIIWNNINRSCSLTTFACFFYHLHVAYKAITHTCRDDSYNMMVTSYGFYQLRHARDRLILDLLAMFLLAGRTCTCICYLA